MVRNINEVLGGLYEELSENAENGTKYPSYKLSKMEKITQEIVGMKPGSVLTLIGNNSCIEAAMLIKITEDMAKAGKRVLYINNMDSELAASHLFLAREGKVNRYHLQDAELSADEWKSAANAARAVGFYDIHVYEPKPFSDNTCKHIEGMVSSLGGVDVIVIENMYLLRKDYGTQFDYEKALKILAFSTGAAVISGTNAFHGIEVSCIADKELILSHEISADDKEVTEIILRARDWVGYGVYTEEEYIPEYALWESEIADRE